jgi:hypothetical protein
MPRSVGGLQKVPPWAIDLINNVASRLTRELSFGKAEPVFPSAPVLQSESIKEAERLEYDPKQIPGLRRVQVIRQEFILRYTPEGGRDAPWSLGSSYVYQLPDQANGALLTMWKHCFTAGFNKPFTNRIARWVCRLMWVPEAGGSSTGEVKDSDNLYLWSARYAGRERTVEEAKGKIEGMRSGFLDASLMLIAEERDLALRIGVLPEDEGIAYTDDDLLDKVSPELAQVEAKAEEFLAGKTPTLEQGSKELDLRLSEFGTLNEKASNLIGIAMMGLYTNEEQRFFARTNLNATGIVQSVLDIADDLLSHHKAGGELGDWEPPFEAIREKYLGESA